MNPDRQIMAAHGLEQREEIGMAQRLAQHIGEHLDADRAKIAHSAVGFCDAGLWIVQRQRRDEAGKTLGMALAQPRHLVIGKARVIRRRIRRAEQLDRRIG